MRDNQPLQRTVRASRSLWFESPFGARPAAERRSVSGYELPTAQESSRCRAAGVASVAVASRAGAEGCRSPAERDIERKPLDGLPPERLSGVASGVAGRVRLQSPVTRSDVATLGGT